MPVVWSGPVLKRGFLDSVFEWVGKIDASHILGGTAAHLIAEYLWELIKNRRDRQSTGKAASPITAEVPHLPLFSEAQNVTITIAGNKNITEIEIKSIDRETLLAKVQALLADETTQ
jgi:hypothetical protein